MQGLEAQLGAHALPAEATPEQVQKFELEGGQLREKIQKQTALVVEIHRLGSPLQDAAVAKLCEEFTATEAQFSTTDLRLIYRQVGSA